MSLFLWVLAPCHCVVGALCLRPISYIKLSGIDHPVMQCHTPEQRRPQPCHCESNMSHFCVLWDPVVGVYSWGIVQCADKQDVKRIMVSWLYDMV